MDDRQQARRTAFERLYRETADCGDMARGWFDGPGMAWRGGLSPDDQTLVATESLLTTARLMRVMSWLLDPAHGDDDAGLRPFRHGADDPLAPGHPLHGQPGGTIAAKSRELAARATALSALYQEA